MKFYSALILTLVSLFLFSSCTPAAHDKTGTARTIGIWNQLPDAPKYIKKKTLVFRHKTATYDTSHFKQMATRQARDYLESKGFNVIEVQDKDALSQGRADMVIQIEPMDIFKQEGTRGYGFYDRRILAVLIKQPARAYVCLNMTLHKKESSLVKRTGRQESFSTLTIKELPDSPDQLTEKQRQEMAKTLEQTIQNNIFKALGELGL